MFSKSAENDKLVTIYLTIPSLECQPVPRKNGRIVMMKGPIQTIIKFHSVLSSLGIQSHSQMMIRVSNHLLSIVFRFHYHSQKVIGSLGHNYSQVGLQQMTRNEMTLITSYRLIWHCHGTSERSWERKSHFFRMWYGSLPKLGHPRKQLCINPMYHQAKLKKQQAPTAKHKLNICYNYPLYSIPSGKLRWRNPHGWNIEQQQQH